MVERRSIILKQLRYEGIFNVGDLYNIIDDWIIDKGYDKAEPIVQEIVTEGGKSIFMKVVPWKKTSDYHQNFIKTTIHADNIKDVTVEIDGVKKKMQKGKVLVKFEGYIATDYEGKMQNKPFYFFIREVFDRFIYQRYTGQSEGLLLEDVHHIWLTTRRYFNMYQPSKG